MATNKEDDEINRKSLKLPKYIINRDVITYESLIENTDYIKSDTRILTYLRDYWLTFNLRQTILNLFPIIKWLPKYSIKKYLCGDVISGLTVGIVLTAQGMAYGLLANVSPNIGLYTSFFPVLIYIILGTSNHISLGTFSIMSLLTLSVVQKHATENLNNVEPGQNVITPLDVVQAITFCTAIINMFMFIARLGFLTHLLNEPLVNGFTTGTVFHIFTVQLKDLFGITAETKKTSPLNYFKVANGLYFIISNITTSNWYTIIFSCAVLLLMIMMNKIIGPWLKKKSNVQIPAEMFCLIFANLISKYVNVHTKYNISIIGFIPTGFPKPMFPSTNLIIAVFTDSIAITVVSFSLCEAWGLVFAKKYSYEISANQELFAFAMCNLLGSVMSCLPIGCSLSRTILRDQTGGMTQISSLVSSLFLLAIILWIGPWFETLPKCVLSAIILGAVTPMLLRGKKIITFCNQGKLRGLNWVITFFGVLILDVDIGLFMGIIFSIYSVYINGLKNFGYLVGTKKYFDNDIYVDMSHHNYATEVDKIKIYRHCGAINFTSVLRENLYKSLSIDYNKISPIYILLPEDRLSYDTLILDLSCCNHIDFAGCEELTLIVNEMRKVNVRVFIAAPIENVYEKLAHSMTLGQGPFDILLTLHDAVLYAQATRV